MSFNISSESTYEDTNARPGVRPGARLGGIPVPSQVIYEDEAPKRPGTLPPRGQAGPFPVPAPQTLYEDDAPKRPMARAPSGGNVAQAPMQINQPQSLYEDEAPKRPVAVPLRNAGSNPAMQINQPPRGSLPVTAEPSAMYEDVDAQPKVQPRKPCEFLVACVQIY